MSFSIKKVFIGLGIVLLILAIINAYFFINRNTNPFLIYSKNASYGEIYIQEETPHISGFETPSEDSLLIKLNNKASYFAWNIVINDSLSYSYNGINPVLKLFEGRHNYTIINSSLLGVPLNLTILVTLKESYEKRGNSGVTNYFIEKTSLPVINYPLYSLKKWTFDYSEVPESQNNEAKKMLLEQMQILESDSSLVKIKKIGKFILDHYESHRGIPTDAMRYFTPLEQFKCVINNQSEVWCGNFATIFGYFANLAGVPTRNVGTEAELDSVSLSAHSFCESYIKEQNRWAFVDLTSNKLFITNENHKVLNSMELVFLQHTGRKENVNAMVYKNDTLKSVPYESVDALEEMYFKVEGMLTMTYPFTVPHYNSAIHKLYRYITEYPYSLCYSFAHQRTNTLYFFKQACVYLFAFVFTVWGISGIILILSKKRY